MEARGGDEHARIADFGIAILRDGSDSLDRLTTGGIVLGTPHYMAPEMAMAGPFDHRVDLFSLGVICYELLTGRFPFDGNGVDVVHAYVHDDIPAMSARAPWHSVDPMLEGFTRRLLARSPDDRPPDAATAREQLELITRVLRGRPTQPMMHVPSASQAQDSDEAS